MRTDPTHDLMFKLLEIAALFLLDVLLDKLFGEE